MKSISRKMSRGRTPQGGPNPIDVHVGKRIRMRRNLLGWSQEKLGEMLGLTFQQVQKYEKGLNRVSASRLWDFSVVLDTSVSFFFEDMDVNVAQQSPRMFSNPVPNSYLREDLAIFDTDPMLKEETMELVKAYYKIGNRQAAKHLFNLIVSMAKSSYLCSKDDCADNEE